MELRLFRAQFEEEFGLNWHDSGFARDSPRYNEYIASCKRNLAQVNDPKLREILWPKFDLWCRRVLFHSEFYPCLNEPHVKLIQERIVRIEKDGVLSADQDSRDKVADPNAKQIKREYDILIYATGWAIAGGKPAPFPILGEGGLELMLRSVNLDHGTVPELQTYAGVMNSNFPNLICPGGALGVPLSGLFARSGVRSKSIGFGPKKTHFDSLPFSADSVIDTIEMHVAYAVEIIKYCLAKGIRSIVPKHEAVLRWVRRVDEGTNGTPVGTQADCSGFLALRRADGTENRRIYFPGLPAQLGKILQYPVWSDFEMVEEQGRWELPKPPLISRLDEAYQRVHLVV